MATAGRLPFATMSEPDPPDTQAADPAAAAEPPAVRPVDLRDYAVFSPEAATRVRVFATDRLALDLWCLEPNQATEVLHLPDQDVTYTVIGGRSWFVTDEGEVGLDPMGAMLIRAGTVHGIDNRAPDPLVIIAVASPPGEGTEDPAFSTDAEAVRLDDSGPLQRAARTLRGMRRAR